MKIVNPIFDNLTEQAKASERLRINLDLRDSINDLSHTVHALESGTCILEMKNGA